VARRELPGLRQRHIAIRVEQADGVVDVVEIDDHLVEHALMMLDRAGDLAALLDQAGDGVGPFDGRAVVRLDLPI
jgi:hypothetical protein